MSKFTHDPPIHLHLFTVFRVGHMSISSNDYKLLKVINHYAFKFLIPYSTLKILGSERNLLNK